MKKILVIAIVVVAAFTGGFLYYLNGIGPVDPENTEDVAVQIPEGRGPCPEASEEELEFSTY